MMTVAHPPYAPVDVRRGHGKKLPKWRTTTWVQDGSGCRAALGGHRIARMLGAPSGERRGRTMCLKPCKSDSPLIRALRRELRSGVGALAKLDKTTDWAIKAWKRIEGRCADYVRQIAKIQRNTRKGNCKGARSGVRYALKGFNAAVAAAVLVVSRRPETVSEITYKTVLAFARTIDPMQKCDEPIAVWSKPKAKGGHRTIRRFGPRRLAVQLICKHLQEAQGLRPEFDAMSIGFGGTHAAVREVGNWMVSGSKAVVTADIENFFGSVNPKEAQKASRIPRRVFREYLTVPPWAEVHILGNHGSASAAALQKAARRGLPQGSPTSGIIGSAVLRPALEALTGGERILIYGDDLAVGAASRKDGEALLRTLVRRLAKHHAGPLIVKSRKVWDTKYFVDYLGYRIFVKQMHGQVWPEFVPNQRSFKRIWDRAKAAYALGVDDVFALTDYIAQTFWAAYPNCKATPAAVQRLSNLLAQSLIDQEFGLLPGWTFKPSSHWKCGSSKIIMEPLFACMVGQADDKFFGER